MGNMSYCRFENTVEDLVDCQDSMDVSDLSKSEESARRKLIRICCDIASDWGDELDEE